MTVTNTMDNINKHEILLQKQLQQSQIQELKKLDPALEVISDTTILSSVLGLSSTMKYFQTNQLDFKIIGNPNALVCIFEFFNGTMGFPEKYSKGLLRITPINNSELLIDMSVSQMQPGEWKLDIYSYGDFSNELESIGDVAIMVDKIKIDADGNGRLNKVIDGHIFDLIGRAACLVDKDGQFVGGILARSAGLFENKKRVCACSGRTIWEEE